MEIPRHWRLKAQRCRLEGSRCPSCGQLLFPPRPVCAQCHYVGPLTKMASERLAVVLMSTDPADIQSHIKYQIMERMIR